MKDRANRGIRTINDGYRSLVAAIILQAMNDYRYNKNYRPQVTRFFNSKWGKYLIESMDLCSEKIINTLKSYQEVTKNAGKNQPATLCQKQKRREPRTG